MSPNETRTALLSATDALSVRLRSIANNATQRAIESVGRITQTDADAHMCRLIEDILGQHLQKEVTRDTVQETETVAVKQPEIDPKLAAVEAALIGNIEH